MTDTSGIDRFFDAVDSVLDKLDHGIKRTERTEQLHKVRRTEAPPRRVEKSTALKVRRFRIIESTDATSGAEMFVVTDDHNARCECTTREFALKLLAALEAE